MRLQRHASKRRRTGPVLGLLALALLGSLAATYALQDRLDRARLAAEVPAVSPGNLVDPLRKESAFESAVATKLTLDSGVEQAAEAGILSAPQTAVESDASLKKASGEIEITAQMFHHAPEDALESAVQLTASKTEVAADEGFPSLELTSLETPSLAASAELTSNDTSVERPQEGCGFASGGANETGREIKAVVVDVVPLPTPPGPKESAAPLANVEFASTPSATSALMPRPPDAPQLGQENISYIRSRLEKAIARAERGALYSARSLFIETLREVCRMLDATAGGRQYATALAAGLRALDEADDFQYRGMQFESDLEVDSFIVGHETPVLKGQRGVSALRARDAYYAYARDQLMIACGGQPVAGTTCYGLGRVEKMLQAFSPRQRKCGPREIPLFEVSLAIAPDNALAANELGVALAEAGQLRLAAAVLHHCVQLAPTHRTLNNLANVYQRLGDSQNVSVVQGHLARIPVENRARDVHPEVRLISAEEFLAGSTSVGQPPRTAARQPTSPAQRAHAQRASRMRAAKSQRGIASPPTQHTSIRR